MDDSLSYKTIFILDCCQEVLRTKCGATFDIDTLNRNRSSSDYVAIPSISKSLYTCAVEAIFEYSRIVWDLFPNGEKLLKFNCCLPDASYLLNTWEVQQQNYEALLDLFSKFTPKLKPTSRNGDLNFLIKGFVASLSALSSFQQDPMSALGSDQVLPGFSLSKSASSNNRYTNCGRIILLTYLISEAELITIKEEVRKAFINYNQKIVGTTLKEGMFVQCLDVIVINSFPIGSANMTNNNIVKSSLSDTLTFSFYSVPSSSYLTSKLTCLAFDHYQLASTTVSGIPMKEEQNAGSSANYDVEIAHSRKAHDKFFQFASLSMDKSSFYTKREGQEYETLILKWCAPKNNTLDQNHCIGAHRITAVDVSSRPSSCLINFLYSGKSVILEMSRIKNMKINSHSLQAHGGELFIHVFSCPARPLVEDVPSISEGVGGRAMDYRINEFAEFMKKHHLSKDNLGSPRGGLKQALVSLNKYTLYWPMLYGLTVFFNIREKMQTFYHLIAKENLSEPDSYNLKQTIYYFLTNESKGANLPIQSNTLMIKGLKREEIYRIFWNELEHLLRCFSHTPNHQQVLQCFVDCRPKGETNQTYCLNTIQPLESNGNGATTTENGKQEEPTKKINFNLIKQCEDNLESIYVKRLAERKRKPDFQGRIKKMKLYANEKQ